MRKPSKRLAPTQYLIILAVLALVAYLRLQGNGSTPAPAEPTQANLPQIQIVLSPTKISATALPKATKTAQPQVDSAPSATVASPLLENPHLDQFDFFVLALSWSPDYCATNGSNDPQQCSIGKKLGFVLHGLWPQYNKGYPSNCSTEKMPASVKAQFAGLYPNDNLFDHEWEKHGTCTGLTPAEYLQFGKQLKASVAIPAEFRSPEAPFRTTSNALKTSFGALNLAFSAASFEVSCSGSGRYLKEIYVCFARDGSPTACSAEMQKTAQKSCQAADFLVRNTR